MFICSKSQGFIHVSIVVSRPVGMYYKNFFVSLVSFDSLTLLTTKSDPRKCMIHTLTCLVKRRDSEVKI